MPTDEEWEEDGSSAIGKRRSSAQRDPTPGYQERKQRLLDPAAEVFRLKGLEAASINDIAAGADTDRATVYYYFANKHEIFLALVSEGVTENVRVAEEIARSTGPAPARLRSLLRAVLDNYERTYPYMQVYWRTCGASPRTGPRWEPSWPNWVAGMRPR